MYLQGDWIDLLREFNAEEVKYLVIGAAAMAVHGEIRGTDDFDVWVRDRRSNVFTSVAGADTSRRRSSSVPSPPVTRRIWRMSALWKDFVIRSDAYGDAAVDVVLKTCVAD